MAKTQSVKRRRKTWRCTDCGETFKSGQAWGAHKRNTGHMGGTPSTNGSRGEVVDISALVSQAMRVIQDEMAADKKKLTKIGKLAQRILDVVNE